MAQTVGELAKAFNLLRGTRSYTDLDKAARPHGLARSTLSSLLTGRSVPTRDTVVTFLAACGLDGERAAPWLAAWERVATVNLHRPAGAVRVREARARLLGVHASIQVAPAATDLPVYVPRDLDADLRTTITAAADQGGLVILVGGSSVGKTRALFEAIRAVAPEWWLIHPDHTDRPSLRELAAEPTPRTVVWLDEMQRYLDAPSGLAAATIRTLITAGTVVLATLWPDEYTRRTAPQPPGTRDQYSNDRELLRLGQVLTVPDTLSRAERGRGERLADVDQRIRIALDSPDAGFTQVLAAGPHLVRWWETAPTPYGKAIITAALDARRVGATAPLARALLEAAAPGYLTPTQQANAPENWLDQAIEYATTPQHGSAATLTPVPAGMGRVAGYTVADYLYQHARQVRRTSPLPDIAWQALIDHHHPADVLNLAGNAHRRGRDEHAETLYRHAANGGDKYAADHLAGLLVEQGRVNEAIAVWKARADAGERYAAQRVTGLLVEQGRMDEAIAVWKARADAGERYAAHRVAGLLDDQRLDELRALSDAISAHAARKAAGLLPEQRRMEKPWTRADTGEQTALRVAGMLAQQGRVDEAIAVWQARADAEKLDFGSQLVALLAQDGRMDEAIAVFRDLVDASAGNAAHRLAEQGQTEELQARADAGDRYAAHRLAHLLAEQGRMDELRTRADANAPYAAGRLADLLTRQGHVDEAIAMWQARADAGDLSAARSLADLLAEQGQIDKLRARADAGDLSAAHRLARLLAEQGRVDELRTRADANAPYTEYAAICLADLLAEQGQIDELRTRTDAGDLSAEHRLAELLAEQHLIADLQAEVHAGTRGAALSLRAYNRAASQHP